MFSRAAVRASSTTSMVARRGFHSTKAQLSSPYHYPEGPLTNIPFNPKTKFFAVRYWSFMGKILFGRLTGSASAKVSCSCRFRTSLRRRSLANIQEQMSVVRRKEVEESYDSCRNGRPSSGVYMVDLTGKQASIYGEPRRRALKNYACVCMAQDPARAVSRLCVYFQTRRVAPNLLLPFNTGCV
jgi:cytochrome c oxidase subunit 7c